MTVLVLTSGNCLALPQYAATQINPNPDRPTMPSSLPIALIAAWVIFFGSVNTHQRHAANFRGASQGFAVALQGSTILGVVVGLGLLGYYFTHVSWYWPLVLFAVGSVLGGLVFGFIDAKVGQPTMSLLAFVGWPAGAVWAFIIIRGFAA